MFYNPENSQSAFQFCVDNDFSWVECDIRLTRDRVPVVFHDDRLALNGGHKCALRDVNYDELAEFHLKNGEPIPRLEDVLEQFGKMLHFDLEIKELDAARSVIEMVREFGVIKRVIISSFLPDVLQVCRNLEPLIERGFLIDRLAGKLTGSQNAVQGAKLLGCRYLLPHFHRLNAEWVHEARQEGLKIIPWTVNSHSDIEKFWHLHTDGIITDKPLYSRTFIRKLQV